MNPIKLRFYTERYEKENRHIRLREKFTVGIRTQALTGKFYAKHDTISPGEIRQEYVDFIKRRMELIPKEIYDYKPPSVNMEYGWFAEPLIPRSNDPRLYFPKTHCNYIRNELLLRKLHKSVPVEKFTGVPFKV